MKSGLGDRNKNTRRGLEHARSQGLNEVRSWRPEQSWIHGRARFIWCPAVSMKSGLGDRNNAGATLVLPRHLPDVSMKSGLGDRNNHRCHPCPRQSCACLNEVRSWRPEQSTWPLAFVCSVNACLNEVRSWRPEQSHVH